MNYGSGAPVRIRTIADTHGIPSRFLVQILLQLKGAGFVSSTRGAAGGYRLAKDPARIALGDVMHVVDGDSIQLASSSGAETLLSRTLFTAWQHVADIEREMLSGVTFADLVEQVRGQPESMYYI